MASKSKPSDIELVICNFIRNQYEAKYKQNVPMALKYLTLKFSDRIIGCKLLTIKQDMDFFQLLSTKLPSIRRFKFLFRASDHQYSADKFHEYCDNKPGTITIIKSNHGNIFGGYTSKSWQSKYGYVKDERAFLFLIKSDDESVQSKCPLLLKLNKWKVDCAVYCYHLFGPTFGSGLDICIRNRCDRKIRRDSRWSDVNYARQQSYDTPKVIICGGNTKDVSFSDRYLFQVKDYEVFQTV